MAQRRARHNREVRKKLQKEDKKEQKATELPKENLNKKRIYFRQKEGAETQQRSVLPLSFSWSFYATCP